MQLDVKTLNALFRQGRSEKDPARQLELCRDFLDQYTGDFLPSLSGRRWVLPKASALSQKYLSVVLRACDLLLAGGERSSASALSAASAPGPCDCRGVTSAALAAWQNTGVTSCGEVDTTS